MKPIWPVWRLPFVLSSKTALYGVLANSLPSAMVSRSSRLPLSLVRNSAPHKTSHLTEEPEDDKVSTDELQEKIAEFEDFVQSTDIAAMQSWDSLRGLLLTLANSSFCRTLDLPRSAESCTCSPTVINEFNHV